MSEQLNLSTCHPYSLFFFLSVTHHCNTYIFQENSVFVQYYTVARVMMASLPKTMSLAWQSAFPLQAESVNTIPKENGLPRSLRSLAMTYDGRYRAKPNGAMNTDQPRTHCLQPLAADTEQYPIVQRIQTSRARIVRGDSPQMLKNNSNSTH